jgi:hypothetical protein
MRELSEAIESKAVSRYACHRTPKSVRGSKPMLLFAQAAVGRRFSVIQLVLDRLERFQKSEDCPEVFVSHPAIKHPGH